MADPVAPKSQPPLGKKRAIQRCPNCDIRCDVSLFVEGSLARCGHCGVRFEVHREASVPPPRPQPPAETPRATVTPNLPLPRLEGFIVLEALPPAKVKNREAPVEIYRVLEALETT